MKFTFLLTISAGCAAVSAVLNLQRAALTMKSESTAGGFINVDAAGGNGEWGPFFGLNVAVPGVMEAQMMMVDVGSSTLAFCDGAGMDSKLTPALHDPPQGQCTAYGSAKQDSYWVGSVYKTDVDLVSDGDTVGVMKDVEFATMASQKGMTCGGGQNQTKGSPPMPAKLAGISGIAFGRGNSAYTPLPDPMKTFTDTIEQSSTGALGACPCGGSCPAGVELVDDPTAFLEFLTEEGDETFGLAWSGSLGDDEGRIYYGAAAKDSSVSPWNADTALGPVQAIPQDSKEFKDVSSAGLWQINITGVSFNGTALPLQANFCTTNEGACIMDTGNPQLMLPNQACDTLGINADDGTPGELTITVSDWNGSGSSVDVIVDASKFYDPKSFYSCGSPGTVSSVLGFPFWHFYYVVLDDVTDQVWFVPKANGVK